MIYGVQQPDAGEIRFDGTPVHIPNPKAARGMGIGMVFQHFSLFEALTVLENIALGLDEKLGHAELEKRIRGVLAKYGLTLDPHRTVSTLSVGERQRIEIVRALLLNPKLLIMDEPTSVLTPQEVDPALRDAAAASRRAAARSSTSATSSTRSRRSATRATILRGGKVVGDLRARARRARARWPR